MRPRPWLALRKIEKVERALQFAALFSVTLLVVLGVVTRYGFPEQPVEWFGGADQALSIASATLFAATLAIRYFVMQSAEERITPDTGDRQSIELMRNLVSSWVPMAPEVRGANWKFIETDAELQALGRLNYEGFALSSFFIDEASIAARNRLLWVKNSHCFALILDAKDRTKIIGYSCMLPFSEEAAQLYLAGGFADKHSSALHIVNQGEISAAISILAIVMDKQHSEYWRRGDRGTLATFLTSVIEHGRVLGKTLKAEGCFIAQSEKKSVQVLLDSLGFKKSGHMSAEGFPYYLLKKGQLPLQLQRLEEVEAK